MNMRIAATALALALSIGCAGKARAENLTCDGSYGPRGNYRGFWSWFTIGADGNDCLRTFDDNDRHFQIDWSLNSNGQDAVGGMGWPNGDLYATISYNAGYWSASGKASLQLYGWSCNGAASQEYYIVENWGSSRYVPWDPSQGREASPIATLYSDGDDYDIYITRQNSDAGNGCDGNRYAFYQYWSVRRHARGSGNQSITFANHANAWAQGNRGFNLNGVGGGYQIMGAEGLNSGSGTLNMTVWK